MHRGVRDRLEDILAGTNGAPAGGHLSECKECSDEVAAMRRQSALLRSLRAGDVEPRPGFYARVMERIEAQGPVSMWSLFFDSKMGRGLAVASMVVALSLGAYLISSEPGPEAAPASGAVVIQDDGGILTGSPDRDAVLVNLVTYQGR